MMFKKIKRLNVFSEDRAYRYTLWREWNYGSGYCQFIGLNPSTADETRDDPTLRRCINFAKDWGFSAFCMTNIFALRETKPANMKAHQNPVGAENDKWILNISKDAQLVVAAWGTHGSFLGRDSEVFNITKELYCLGTTKNGFPKHPLYVKGDTQLIKFKKEYENGQRKYR